MLGQIHRLDNKVGDLVSSGCVAPPLQLPRVSARSLSNLEDYITHCCCKPYDLHNFAPINHMSSRILILNYSKRADLYLSNDPLTFGPHQAVINDRSKLHSALWVHFTKRCRTTSLCSLYTNAVHSIPLSNSVISLSK